MYDLQKAFLRYLQKACVSILQKACVRVLQNAEEGLQKACACTSLYTRLATEGLFEILLRFITDGLCKKGL